MAYNLHKKFLDVADAHYRNAMKEKTQTKKHYCALLWISTL